MRTTLNGQTRIYSSSLADVKKKQPISATLASRYNTSNKFYSVNPQMQLLKLPTLDKRSAISIQLTTDRNTKFKVQGIQEKLEGLTNQVHNTRLQANETMKNIKYLKQMLIQTQLQKYKQDLKQKTDDLDKLIRITKSTNQTRFGQLRQSYIRLWNNTQQMRQNIFELTMRVDKIQSTLGYGQRLI